MKKYLWCIAGGLAVLQIVNDEIVSLVVITVIAAVALAKVFPIMMEGTK